MTNTMQNIITLAQKTVDLDLQFQRLNDELWQTNRDIIRSQYTDLPELLSKLDIDTIDFEHGGVEYTLKIKPIIKANLPTLISIDKAKDLTEQTEMKARLKAGLEFLRENGGDEIINNKIIVDVSKENEAIVDKLMQQIVELGIPVIHEQSVNSATLSSYVKERLNNGDIVPSDIFSVHIEQQANIERVK